MMFIAPNNSPTQMENASHTDIFDARQRDVFFKTLPYVTHTGQGRLHLDTDPVFQCELCCNKLMHVW